MILSIPDCKKQIANNTAIKIWVIDTGERFKQQNVIMTNSLF